MAGSAREEIPQQAPTGSYLLDPPAVASLTGGAWHGPTTALALSGASIDSRTIRPGELFACLVGAHRDGHDSAPAAVAKGAALVLAARPLPAIAAPVLVVPDVAAALGRIAGAVRQARTAATWIGITGSSGKTTLKELVAAACASAGETAATSGNLNNHLGVPLTILGMPERVRFAVVEMGANHAGEIASLCAIARPQVGVIASLGPAHLEGFGGIEGVARAKSELFAALPEGATAILGVHGLVETAERLGSSAERLLGIVRTAAEGRRLVLVGGPGCPIEGTIEADGIELRTPSGRARLPLLGAHNLANAACAYQAAIAAGVAPERALKGMRMVKALSGRLKLHACGAVRIIDDSYNANPGSVIAGLEVLAAAKGRRLAVLGEMGELGAERELGHRLVGAEAARLGLQLVVVGARAEPIASACQAGGGSCELVADRPAAVRAVVRWLDGGPGTVLVKGSRVAGLEQVVAALLGRQIGGEPC
jgi:UDP-N-acetylmuramoyl-tripeptide--D-alanyl-D-alanine ligase